ncbi:MAG: porin [Hyphomicrobiales bacterium]|nr:porin [Hyphomicrobiales bacterium]
MNFKTVLLAAAALGVAGTAQAADLAKKAPAAANYVKICDAYGAGFFYIPGSDTCLKIGGYVRAELRTYSHDRDWGGSYGWSTRTQHGVSTRARADLTFDARTATEFGLLRSYVDLYMTVDSTSNAATTTLDKAFIQFGGLTAGRATSFFDFWTGETYGSFFEPAHSDTNINLFGYTFAFGNGITASVSIEDPSTGSAGRRDGNGASPYAGVKMPDLVANVNIAQAWGSAQLMAALHQNYSAIAKGGVDSDKMGYAIGAGVKINLPMLGASDQLAIQAAYGKGAVSYVSPDWGQDANSAARDFYVPATSIEQSDAWSIAAGLTHGWTKTISTSIEGSYASFDLPKTSASDFKQWDVQGNIVWTPVDNLTIGAEVEYRYVDYAAASGLKDVGAFVGLLRIQRNF